MWIVCVSKHFSKSMLSDFFSATYILLLFVKSFCKYEVNDSRFIKLQSASL